MENLLVYIVDTSVSNYLGFKLVHFHPIIKKYFQNKHAYYDYALQAAVVGCPKLILSRPNEGTMGITQYIKGFVSNIPQQFEWRWLFFNSNEERNRYADRLLNLMQAIAKEIGSVDNGVTCLGNPRVTISYK